MSMVTIRYAGGEEPQAKAADQYRQAGEPRGERHPLCTGFRHRNSKIAESSGTIQPWEYCGLLQLAWALSRPGQ